jgi:hypothetical protein
MMVGVWSEEREAETVLGEDHGVFRAGDHGGIADGKQHRDCWA